MTPSVVESPVRHRELLAQRACFAVLIFIWFTAIPLYGEQPDPVGVARYLDLAFLANPAVLLLLEIGLAVALFLYAAGVAATIATAYIACLWIAAGTLSSSQGGFNHSTQLVGMVLLAQLLAYAQAGAARRSGKGGDRRDGHELAVWYSQQMIVASYLLAGLMKIFLSLGKWVQNLPNLSVEIVKTHHQYGYSNLDLGLLERGDQLAALLLAHPNATRFLLSGALFLELSSIAALIDRRAGIVVGLGLWVMHRLIAFLMLIEFRQNEALLLIYIVGVPALLVRWLWRACTSSGKRSSAPPFEVGPL